MTRGTGGGARSVLSRWARSAVPTRWRRSERLVRQLRASSGGRILAGPFAGCAYGERSHGSAYWPKVLGTYEQEVAPVVEGAIARGFDLALVAGAAEGYYAIGLAARAPGARVIAWEANPEARDLLREGARRNGVEGRIEVRGLCDLGELEAALERGERTFLVADLEGGEAVLLDPVALPRLSSVEILVETHEPFLPGLEARLETRFATSHELRWIDARARTAKDLPDPRVGEHLAGALEQLLSERRPPGIRWLHLRPASDRA